MNKYDILIGIDPDSKKSGVALWNVHKKYSEIKQLTFFELFDYIKYTKERAQNVRYTVQVVIESGWQNKSNWHVNKSQPNAVSSLIGNKTGLNHQTGILIEQMCKYLEVDYRLVRPTTAKWTPETCFNITKIKLPKSKQDCIDALKLVYC